MLLRATENAVAGLIWPAGRYLPTPAIYQSSLQCDFCIPYHLANRSVTKGRAWPPWKNFLSPEKCLGHILCITNALVHAIDVKFGSPSEILLPLVSKAGYGSAGDCWLVTFVSYATQLSLFTIKVFSFFLMS